MAAACCSGTGIVATGRMLSKAGAIRGLPFLAFGAATAPSFPCRCSGRLLDRPPGAGKGGTLAPTASLSCVALAAGGIAFIGSRGPRVVRVAGQSCALAAPGVAGCLSPPARPGGAPPSLVDAPAPAGSSGTATLLPPCAASPGSAAPPAGPVPAAKAAAPGGPAGRPPLSPAAAPGAAGGAAAR